MAGNVQNRIFEIIMKIERVLANGMMVHDAGDYFQIYSDKGKSIGCAEVIIGETLYYMPRFATVKKSDYPELKLVCDNNQVIEGELREKIEKQLL